MKLPDLRASLMGDTSIYPGLRTSGSGGTTTGDWVDMDGSVGSVYGHFSNGVVSGSGSFAQSLSCKLQEADDNSGTGVQDVDGAAVTIAENKGWGLFRGVRTKRYVRAVVINTVASSSTPNAVNDLSGAIFAEKARF
jgi:hypothetical protein